MKKSKVSKRIAKMISRSALLAFAALNSAAYAGATFNAPADVKAIKTIEDDLALQTSMKNLIKYYAPDAVVMDIFAPGIYKGSDQIFKGFEAQMAQMQTMKSAMPDINIATDGKFACAAMTLQFNATMKNGSKNSITLRQLDAFKKINGKWLIEQQHISLPVDAKTGMAVFNGPLPVRGPIKWAENAIPAPSTTTAEAKQEIRKWMEVGALSTSLQQLMTYYGPGDDVLIYDTYFPGELRGRQEISNYYAAIMNSYNGISVKMPEFYADSDGAFGIQIDTQEMVLDMKDGSKKKIALRQSDCMRRVNGKWLSFFEMISYPIDAKTGKAIME